MLTPQQYNVREAVELIRDGDTIATIGMTMMGIAEAVFKEIERSFLEKGHPRDLILFHPAGFSDRFGGIEHLAHEGLLKRIIGSHWGLAPKIMNMISNSKVEAYCMPFGVMNNMFHDMCGKKPGSISRIGLETFLDPRYEGGKMNPISTADMVKRISIDGEEFLQYKHIPLDYLIIRATYADEDGNLSCVDEPIKMETLPAVLAAKRYGGKVVAQVKRIVKNGSLPPKEVEVPGVFVDGIVVCENLQEDHKQSCGWYQDDSCCGKLQVPESSISPMPLNERKVIVRRAAMYMYHNAIINTGTGVPTDAMGPILAEEGLKDSITLTVESGVYGGVPAGGGDFGISRNPTALIPQNVQFDLYNGRGVDFTFMGCGEMDEDGNVNSTKMGNIAPGCGGFIDITTMAKTVCFCSTFTVKGLRVSFDEKRGLTILQEGTIKKFKKKVMQVSYNAKYNTSKGQKAYFVTERAVFELTEDGPVLIEIAKGIDLQRDVLDQMEFVPSISPGLKTINPIIYRDGLFGLKEIFDQNTIQEIH